MRYFLFLIVSVCRLADAATIVAGEIDAYGTGARIFFVDPTTGDRAIMMDSKIGSGPTMKDIKEFTLDKSLNLWTVARGSVFSISGFKDRVLVSGSTMGSGDLPKFMESGAVLGDDGFAYTTGWEPECVVKIDPVTGDRSYLSAHALGIGSGPKMESPRSIQWAQDGYILVGTLYNSVFKVDPMTGDRTLVSGPGVGSGDPLSYVENISIIDSSRILVASSHSYAAVEIDLATGDRKIISGKSVGSGEAFGCNWNPACSGPDSVDWLDPDTLIASDGYSDSILKIDYKTGDRTVLSSSSVGLGPRFTNLGYIKVAGR